MWSVVQYKRIGRDVRQEFASRRLKKVGSDSSQSPDSSSPDTDLSESPTTKQPHPDSDQSDSHALDSSLPAGCKHATHDDDDDKDKDKESDKSSSESSPSTKIDTTTILVTERPNDPINPQNWPLAAKAQTLSVLILLIISQAWAGSAQSVANTTLRKNFDISATVADAEIATYLFGIGAGSLFAGPISQCYGRNATYLGATVGYLLFVLGTCLISESFAALIVCRFFVGLFASAVLGVNGATVRDLLGEEERSWIFPLVAWANVVGPVISPIVGGAIDVRYSPPWKWDQWTTLIIGCFVFIVALLFMPETHLPMLLEWRAAQLRKTTKDERYTTEWASSAGFFTLAKETIPKPVTLFATDLVIAVFGGYLILLYILLFTFLSGFEFLFKEPYGLSDFKMGACFGSIAVGGSIYVFLDPAVRALLKRRQQKTAGNAKEQKKSHDNQTEKDSEQGDSTNENENNDNDSSTGPEKYLWPSILVAPLLPISLFWLGWTSRPSVSIWSPLVACATFGIVIIAMYTSIYEYIIASYGEQASVALASITMARYIIAGGMVMAARTMYMAMGTGWVMTLLGCVAVLLAPAPWLIWRFGPIVRKRSKFSEG